MATMFGSIKRMIHRSSVALIDNQIPKKLADAITGAVSSTFDVVEDLLKVVKDVTEKDDEETEEEEEEGDG